jgi:hypothetical protein
MARWQRGRHREREVSNFPATGVTAPVFDLGAFLTVLYVMADDFCREHLPQEPVRAGPALALSCAPRSKMAPSVTASDTPFGSERNSHEQNTHRFVDRRCGLFVFAPAAALAQQGTTQHHGGMQHEMHVQMGRSGMTALRRLSGRAFDVAFLSQMTEHHQGAVDMTRAALPTLKNAHVKKARAKHHRRSA